MIEIPGNLAQEVFSVYYLFWNLSHSTILVKAALQGRDNGVEVGFEEEGHRYSILR